MPPSACSAALPNSKRFAQERRRAHYDSEVRMVQRRLMGWREVFWLRNRLCARRLFERMINVGAGKDPGQAKAENMERRAGWLATTTVKRWQ